MSLEVCGAKWLVEYDAPGWTTLAATKPKIMEELNGHEEATFQLPNTAANRAIVAEDRDVRISYDGAVVWSGLLSIVDYNDEILICSLYNECYETMKPKVLTATYSGIAANEILADVCSAAGVSAGTCPTTALGVRFDLASCYDAGRFLAKVLNKDYWGEGGTFNIGVRDNCVLCLPFEENAGTVTADLSGHGNNGTITGGSWTTGKYGYGLSLDGIADYCVVNDVDLANKSFSVMTWVKRLSAGTEHHFCGQGITTTNNGLHIGFLASDIFRFGFYDDDLDTTDTFGIDSNFHLWSCIYDADTKNRYVYHDGTLNVSGTASANYQGTGIFYVGQSPWASPFYGLIDEFRIYNRALTAEEVAFHYNNSLGKVSVRKVDRSKRRNHIIIKGVDENDDRIYGEAGSGTNTKVFREQKATNEATLNLLATQKLAELDTDNYNITVVLKPQHGALLHPGDIIPVVSEKFDLEANYRIQRITKTPEQVTEEPARATQTADQILEELQQFEELGITTLPNVTPSENVRWSNDTERETQEPSYTKVKEIRVGETFGGTIRLKFTLDRGWDDNYMEEGAVYGRVYKNGTAIGAEGTVLWPGNPTVFGEDFASPFNEGDLLQVYAHATEYGAGGEYSIALVSYMRICYDPALELPFTNQDP